MMRSRALIFWKDAIKEKISTLKKNETWDLVIFPNGILSISCKWLHKVKMKSDGSTKHHKIRLIARKFLQKYGVDFDETYCPIAK